MTNVTECSECGGVIVTDPVRFRVVRCECTCDDVLDRLEAEAEDAAEARYEAMREDD